MAAPDTTRRRAERLCLTGIGLSGVYSLALLPVAPSLLGSHPVLLELLRGSISSMVAGGAFARVGHASLLLALLAPFPVVVMADPLFWWAGRLWGPQAGHMVAGGSPRGRRLIARAVRGAERYGALAVLFAYFLPLPSALVYAAAGWTGMRLRRFLVLDVLGAALWIGVNVGLGYAIGQRAVDVAQAISRYALYFTIGLVVVIVLVSARRAGVDPEPTDVTRAP